MEINLQQPPPQAGTLEEAQALINELWPLLRAFATQNQEQTQRLETQGGLIEEQAQRIDLLEEKLRTNSRNSSKPPSSDPHKGKAAKTHAKGKRKPGGQPGHAGKARELLAEEHVTHFHDCRPESHCACGGRVAVNGLVGRHQVIDVPPIAPTVTQYRLYGGRCRRCGKLHEAALPPGVSMRMAGPRLLALIGTLTGGYRLSRRLVRGLLQDVFGLSISLGAISESEAVLHAALAPVAQEAHDHVQRSPVVHSDETGHREKGRGQWMWVAIGGMVSVFMACLHRNAQAAKDMLGMGFAGILVSDRYGAYTWVDTGRRQLCWAHLLRDFKKISERSGKSGRIGEELIELTNRMFRFWHAVRDGRLCREMFVCHMDFLGARIVQTLRQGSECGESHTANTCRNVLKMRQALWTFVETPGIEPTNNLAERTLRHYVMWRKISLGTQSRRGSEYVARRMTVVGSCKLQGRNILDFVTQAVRAHWGNGKAPSLVHPAAG
jgi:transposase